MYLNDFKQEYSINSLDELNEILVRRFSGNSNYFILTFEDNGFPQLSSFVKDNLCVIYYMGEGENFVSQGNTIEDGIEIFYENENGTQIPISKSNVVPINKLYEAAKCFFETNEKPFVIEWMKL